MTRIDDAATTINSTDLDASSMDIARALVEALEGETT